MRDSLHLFPAPCEMFRGWDGRTRRVARLILFPASCFQADSVLSVAEDVKNVGNTLFKNQDWKAAVSKYSKALR